MQKISNKGKPSWHCKNCCWVLLVNQDELITLIDAMKTYGFDGKIVSAVWKDHDKIGPRLHVSVQIPGTKPGTSLRGFSYGDYERWQKVKAMIYRKRKNIKDPFVFPTWCAPLLNSVRKASYDHQGKPLAKVVSAQPLNGGVVFRAELLVSKEEFLKQCGDLVEEV